MQTLYLGVPSARLFDEKLAFSNVAIEAGWAPALHTIEWIKQKNEMPANLKKSIPPNATANIALLAEAELRKEGV